MMMISSIPFRFVSIQIASPAAMARATQLQLLVGHSTKVTCTQILLIDRLVL